MHIAEKAFGALSRLSVDFQERLLGDETLRLQICNGTDAVLTLAEEPHRSSGECVASFEKLLPGQCGTAVFSGSGGFGSAFRLRVGTDGTAEDLLIGAYTAKLTKKSSLFLQFEPHDQTLKQYYSRLPPVFMGASKGNPDRAAGQRFAACCARSDGGGLAESAGTAGAGMQRDTSFTTLHPSVSVLVADIAEIPASDAAQDQAALPPHLRLCSLDSSQQMTFAEYVDQQVPACLPHALFLAEHAAVARSLRTAGPARLRDEAFTLDLLVGAFPEGALGMPAGQAAPQGRQLCKFGCGCVAAQSTATRRFDTCCRQCGSSQGAGGHDARCAGSQASQSSGDAISAGVERWRRARPAELKAGAMPVYEEYIKLPDVCLPQLQAYVDASRALLLSCVLRSARALKPAADACKIFGSTDLSFAGGEAARLRGAAAGRAIAEALHEGPDEVEVVGGETNSNILCDHLLRLNSPAEVGPTRSGGSSKGLSEESLPVLLKSCMDTSAMHDIRRRTLLDKLRAGVQIPEAREALRIFCDWLPCSRREFSCAADELVPAMTFRSFGSEVFANLDHGTVASPKILLESLGLGSAELSAMSTNSKSGEFFYFSGDKHFLIKTVTDHEGWILDDMLSGYQHHLRRLPRSFIVRFGGLFHMQLEGGMSKFFTVMASVFDTRCKVHETYDVKGSLFQRKAKEGESILKDQDWHENGKRLRLPERLRRELLAVHEADAAFLSRYGVMDYSLLIGVHKLPASGLTRAGFREGGGLYAEGEKEIYFVGLIDFLIFYHLKKEVEHIVRTAQGHEKDASCVSPEDYARRQVEFVRKSVFEEADKVMGTLGVVKVSGMSARNLENKDTFGKSDPYVIACVGLQSEHSPIVKNDLNPTWKDCELHLPINEDHCSMNLRLMLKDADSVKVLQGGDDPLGHLDISVDQLMSGQPRQVEHEDLQEAKHGEVSATVVFERCGDTAGFNPPSRLPPAVAPQR